MAKRLRTSKKQTKLKDEKENQKFLLVVALATIILVILMYFIFR